MHRMLFSNLHNAILQYVFKLQKYVKIYFKINRLFNNFWEKELHFLEKSMWKCSFADISEVWHFKDCKGGI